MTAFNKDQIPNDINTLERLHAWSSMSLEFINPSKSIIEAPGENPERVIQNFVIRAADGSQRYISRTSLSLEPGYEANSTDAMWLLVEEFENVDIPVAYTNG